MKKIKLFVVTVFILSHVNLISRELIDPFYYGPEPVDFDGVCSLIINDKEQPICQFAFELNAYVLSIFETARRQNRHIELKNCVLERKLKTVKDVDETIILSEKMTDKWVSILPEQISVVFDSSVVIKINGDGNDAAYPLYHSRSEIVYLSAIDRARKNGMKILINLTGLGSYNRQLQFSSDRLIQLSN